MDGHVKRSTANAKINLALHVTGQRADSYHLLDTLVVFTAFGDELQIEASETDSFLIEGPCAPLLAGTEHQDNLVIRARDELRRALVAAGGKAPPVAIRLTKNIPVASGMGGGSGDAAAAMARMSAIWNAERILERTEIDKIALSLGADVPMCLTGPSPLRVTGIGEVLDPVTNVPPFHMVLVNPAVPVSTPAVFRVLKQRNNAPLPAIPGNGRLSGQQAGRVELLDWLARETRNDLQSAALSLVPTIGQCLEALENAGALLARMTGSGATCFGLFESSDTAAMAHRTITAHHPEWFCVATQTHGSIPTRQGDKPQCLD